MKIKSVEKLQEVIDADISWRKKELIEMRTLIHTTSNPVFIRSGLVLLCAHFEGFIKTASNYYINFVSYQKKLNKELKTNFIALQLKQKILDCSNSEKTSVHMRLADQFMATLNSNFFIRYSDENPVISTKANPSSQVFEEIVTSLSLDFSLFDTKRKYIDTDLLSNRHKIVHGEKQTITVSDFDDTFQNIIWIIENYKNIILDAAIGEQYLKVEI